MDILTLAVFLIALGYNIYLADKIAKSYEIRFTVELTLGTFHPIQKNRIQSFIDKNQDEFMDKLNKDIINTMAYGVSPPVTTHKDQSSYIEFDKGSKKGDISTITNFTYSDEVNKIVEDLRKASSYFLSRGDHATANYYTKKADEVIANAVPRIIISGGIHDQKSILERIIPDLKNQETFEQLYMGHPYKQPESEKRAFNALMEYEINCFLCYDRQGMPSKTPKKGERIEDYALKYETTVKEMKEQRNAVEDQLKRDGYDDRRN